MAGMAFAGRIGATAKNRDEETIKATRASI